MNEAWLPIAGYGAALAERYEVSDMGCIRVRHDAAPSRNLKLGRQCSLHVGTKGYLQVVLCGGGVCKTFRVHKLVSHAFLGKPEPGQQVNHKDGEKTNNAVSNLEYVSNKVNNRHAWVEIRKNPKAVIDGQPMTFAEAVERFAVPGVSYRSAEQRMRVLGWSMEKALSTPTMKGRP